MPMTTEIFALGTPSLPEGLRTLVVSPAREVEPGSEVHASFAFTNVGGGPATGLRARFSIPPGLSYILGSARIDERPVEDSGGESGLLTGLGADIGEVAAGVETRVAIAYRVAPTIENGTIIELQAALSSLELAIIGSNVVRLLVHSTPELRCDATHLSLEAPRGATPGSEVVVRARVQNAGESSAHDIVVVLPVPDHTIYIPRSALINGREIDDGARREPFGYVNPAIAIAVLGPATTLEVEYRVQVDSPLAQDTILETRGWVSSLESAEFELEPVSLSVNSPTSFEGESTRFEIDAGDEVIPGQSVAMSLHVQNVGTNDAHDASVSFSLPSGLLYVPGSASIGDQPLPQTLDDASPISIGTIAAGSTLTIRIAAKIGAPAPNGRSLPISAKLRWHSGAREFDRTLTVRSQPRFSRVNNYIERSGPPSAKPGSRVTFAIAIRNDGTAQASDARIYLSADFGLTDIVVLDEHGEALQQLERTLNVGVIEPYQERKLTVQGKIVEPISDRTELRLGATLSTPEVADVDLGVAIYTVISRARFSQATSVLQVLGAEAIRPERIASVLVRIVNEGTDGVRDASVMLKISPEARLETVENAIRDGNAVVFGDVSARASREATLRLRLGRSVPSGTQIAIEGWVCGVGMAPAVLLPASVSTFAEPSFSEGAQFTSTPAEAVDAAATLSYALTFSNAGDGVAAQVLVRAYASPHTTYVPGSTTINDVPLADDGGRSPLWASVGLRLENIAPGVEAVVRWRAIVNMPLPVGTLIEAQASIEWDGNHRYDLVAPAVRVRSTPSFAVAASGLPFSVTGTLPSVQGPAWRPPLEGVAASPQPEKLSIARPVETPTAPPEFSPVNIARAISEVMPQRQAALAPGEALGGPLMYADLSRERLERMLGILEEAQFGGLISHLFALRVFFPDGVAGEPALSTRFEAARASLRGVLDPLFIKLRLPRYTVTKRDLEGREARAVLAELIEAMGQTTEGHELAPQVEPVRTVGHYDRARVAELGTTLANAPLGSVTHWQVLAEFLGSTIQRFDEKSDELGIYRRLLRTALSDVATMPVTEFYRILTSSTNGALDDALQNVVAALRQSLDVPA